MNINKAYEIIFKASRSINANGETHDAIIQALHLISKTLQLTQGLPGHPQNIPAQEKVEQEVKEERE